MAPKDLKDKVYRLTALEKFDRSLKEILQSLVMRDESASEWEMPNALDTLHHNELCLIVVTEKQWIANWDTYAQCFILLVGSHPVEQNEIDECWPLDWNSREAS